MTEQQSDNLSFVSQHRQSLRFNQQDIQSFYIPAPIDKSGQNSIIFQQKIQSSISINRISLVSNIDADKYRSYLLDQSEHHVINLQIQSQNIQQEKTRSNGPLMEGDKQKMILVVMITTSKKIENGSLKIFINNKLIKSISLFESKFKEFYIYSQILKISAGHHSTYQLKYNQKIGFLSLSTSQKNLTMANAQFLENVGFISNELCIFGDQKTILNKILFNYCLIFAHSILFKKNDSILKTFNPNYKALIERHIVNYFDKECPQNKNVFKYINQTFYTNLKDYFSIFTVLYKDDALNKANQFKVLDACDLTINSINIFKKETFKQFTPTNQINHLSTLSDFTLGDNEFVNKAFILKANILSQSQEKVKQIIDFVLENEPSYLICLQNQRVNKTIIKNQYISLSEYLKIKYFYALIYAEIDKNTYYHQHSIFSLLNDIIDKAKMEKTTMHEIPLQPADIKQMLYQQGQLNLQVHMIGLLYSKVKTILCLVPKLGQMILKVVQDTVFQKICPLLHLCFQQTIFSMFMVPCLQGQREYLLSYFQKQNISTKQIMYLMEIQTKIDFKQYDNTFIKMCIIKYLQNNPTADLDLVEIKLLVMKLILSVDVQKCRKVYIITLFITILEKGKQEEQTQDLINWCKQQINKIIQ